MLKQRKQFSFLLLYVFGLVQGIAFTTLPGASNFITNPNGLALSITEYGFLFLPMVIGSITASLLGGVLGKRLGLKVVLLGSTIINIFCMALFGLVPMTSHITYGLLLLITVLLGIGFGGTLTSLNPFVIYYFPKASSIVVTALHACLGIGAALGPLLFSWWSFYGLWRFDPAMIALLYFILFFLSYFLLANPKNLGAESDLKNDSGGRVYFYGFVIIAFLYGFLETSFGNWISIFLHMQKGISNFNSNIALSVFWGCITIGRIVTAIIAIKISPRWIYRLLALIILASLLETSFIDNNFRAYLVAGLAGLGCSAFLPLTVSLATEKFLKEASFMSGLLIAVYMAGYACAAGGFGLAHKIWNLSFGSLYLFDIGPGLVVAALCVIVTRSHQKKV